MTFLSTINFATNNIVQKQHLLNMDKIKKGLYIILTYNVIFIVLT